MPNLDRLTVIIAILLIGALWIWVIARNARAATEPEERARRGCCLTCGHQLQPDADQCTECGTAVSRPCDH